MLLSMPANLSIMSLRIAVCAQQTDEDEDDNMAVILVSRLAALLLQALVHAGAVWHLSSSLTRAASSGEPGAG